METPAFARRLVAALLFLAAALPLHASEAEFDAWAKGRMVPLDHSDRAFGAIDRDIEQSRLIGLGESVHESEPFLSFRVRLFKDLVRRHRVTALVFESGLAEAMSLDDYVSGRAGTIDYNASLPGGHAHLVEIRALMEWIRAWNQNEGRKRPVRVYGSDVPGRQANIVPALDRLEQLTLGQTEVKSLIDAVRIHAAKAAGQWWRAAQEKYEALPTEEKNAFTANVTRLGEAVNRLSGADAERLEWARRVAVVVSQAEAMHRLGPFSPTAPRDVAMADNTMWILGRLKKGERAVYWAHNAHVQMTEVTGPALPAGRLPPAGLHFKKRLGERYLAIGAAYGGPSRDGGAPIPPGSVDAALGNLSSTPFLLPLRGGNPSPAAKSWLAEERPMRFQVQHLLVSLGKAFDVVVWFDTATGAAVVKPQALPSGSTRGARTRAGNMRSQPDDFLIHDVVEEALP